MKQGEKNSHLQQLTSYTIADWEPLFSFIQCLETAQADEGNEWIAPFLHAVNYSPDITIKFDWGKWKLGKTVLTSDDPDVSKYDLLTICMFITTIVRADRFSEGFLLRCYRKGILLNLLKMLKKRVSESITE